MPDVILTGIPRSGTTLAAALIDGLPDSVCLNEPGWQVARPRGTPGEFARFVAGDFTRLRQALLAGKPVPDRRGESGEAVTNYYRAQNGRQENTFRIAPFSRPDLSPDFTLAVKHNGPYLAILPELAELRRFTIIAIVRHPVEVIHSWRSLDLPISRGEMPGAAPYWPELAAIIAGPMELLEKQVRLYDLMCRRIDAMRDRIHIIPYEKLVKEPALLSRAAGIDAAPKPGLVGRPSRQMPPEAHAKIAAALSTHGEHYRRFYPEI